jgi:aspartyl-tRNA synthetase
VNLDQTFRRTHTCGELTANNLDQEVVLNGWVDRRRDLGGLIFIDLRDRYGKTQVVFNPEQEAEAHREAEKCRSEYVLAVRGTVQKRLETNPKMPTGEIELNAVELRILNESETPPISITEDKGESEDVRLKYRFLDLRRPAMQKAVLFRHRVMQAARRILSGEGFVEIETPILMKSTPEGARDFLVPSRMNPGKFYALPQSPQTYKQILMVAGYDKYFQLAKCFRDEDLRADRQPEFTQIDCELSFVRPADIYDVFSRFTARLFKDVCGVDIGDIPRMTYQAAMDKYGSDKPDLRLGMEMHDLTRVFKGSVFKVFETAIAEKGAIKGIRVPAGGKFSRKTLDGLGEFVKQYGAKGLIWAKKGDALLEGPAAKFLSQEEQTSAIQALGLTPGDLALLMAGDLKTTNTALGQLRLEIGRMEGLLKNDVFKFMWVTDFPMFEYSETEKRWNPSHHPFTSPLDEDVSLLYGPEYFLARAKAYDLTLNGNEIGGGSIRIHDSKLQQKIFELLGISEQAAREKFGFLLGAFKYGAPPHGGIAYGLDRLLMVMLGLDSIRDTIPFPKTTTGASLMDDAPSGVGPDQLKELGITLKIH